LVNKQVIETVAVCWSDSLWWAEIHESSLYSSAPSHDLCWREGCRVLGLLVFCQDVLGPPV